MCLVSCFTLYYVDYIPVALSHVAVPAREYNLPRPSFFLVLPPTLFQQYQQVLIYYNIFFPYSNSKIIIFFSIVSHNRTIYYIFFLTAC